MRTAPPPIPISARKTERRENPSLIKLMHPNFEEVDSDKEWGGYKRPVKNKILRLPGRVLCWTPRWGGVIVLMNKGG